MTDLQRLKEALSGASLRCRWWGASVALETQERERSALAIGAQFAAIKGSKALINPKQEQWAACNALKRRILKDWQEATIPYVVDGVRLFRRDQRAELWRSVSLAESDLRHQTLLLNQARPQILAEGRELLGAAFQESYYPDDWFDVLGLELSEVNIEPPNYLLHTNAEEYQRELQKSLQAIADSMAKHEAQLMAELGEVSARVLRNCAPGGRVVEANLQTFTSLVGRVHQLRFEGTAVFRKALAQTERILDGVTADDLRRPGGLREDVRSRLAQLIMEFREMQQSSIAQAALSEIATS